MVIMGVLEEELNNSLQLKKKYEEALAKLPKGSLIKKKIKGHEYYYLVLRENGKVKFIYKGKNYPLILYQSIKRQNRCALSIDNYFHRLENR